MYFYLRHEELLCTLKRITFTMLQTFWTADIQLWNHSGITFLNILLSAAYYKTQNISRKLKRMI